MDRNRTFMLYSPATGITGEALVGQLGIQGGTSLPDGWRTTFTGLIGWGAKINGNLDYPTNMTVVNDPGKIRRNRHKLKSLNVMQENDVPVASFADGRSVMTAITALADGAEFADSITVGDVDMTFPVIVRKNYHQGGVGFWIAMTMRNLRIILERVAPNIMENNGNIVYVQEMLPIQDEFRVHVFNGNVIRIVKKTARETPEAIREGYVSHMLEKLQSRMGDGFNEDVVRDVLNNMATDMIVPDLMTRSCGKGWVFRNVNAGNVDNSVVTASINAVAALDLTFGAVDVCTTELGDTAVLEVNTGPRLEGNTMAAYMTAFNSLFTESDVPEPETIQTSTTPRLKGKKSKTGKRSVQTQAAKAKALAKAISAAKTPEEMAGLLDAYVEAESGDDSADMGNTASV